MDLDALKQYLANRMNQNSGLDTLKDQVALTQKRFENPDYEPSDAEKQNEDKYYNNVTSAVAGSIQPTGIAKYAPEAEEAISTLAQRAAKPSLMAQRAADQQAITNYTGDAVEAGNASMDDLRRQMLKSNRAADFAERDAKQAALKKLYYR